MPSSNSASISSPAWNGTRSKANTTNLLEKIKDLLDILAREARVLDIIKDELKAIKDKYATPRLTELVPDEGEIAIEDLIANEGVIITITHNGLIKRTNISSYRAQRRGGSGVIGMVTMDNRPWKARRRISSSISSPPARTIT